MHELQRRLRWHHHLQLHQHCILRRPRLSHTPTLRPASLFVARHTRKWHGLSTTAQALHSHTRRLSAVLPPSTIRMHKPCHALREPPPTIQERRPPGLPLLAAWNQHTPGTLQVAVQAASAGWCTSRVHWVHATTRIRTSPRRTLVRHRMRHACASPGLVSGRRRWLPLQCTEEATCEADPTPALLRDNLSPLPPVARRSVHDWRGLQSLRFVGKASSRICEYGAV